MKEFPYAAGGAAEQGIAAIEAADFLSDSERSAVYSENYKAFLGQQV